MTDLVVQSLTLSSGEYLFVDETSLAATDKGYLLGDWQRFVQQGFKKLLFTGNLYRFLTAECSFSARYNQEYFWAYYFNTEAIRLRAFLNQFGGNKVSAEFNTPAWLGGSAADLKQAMCDEVTFLQGPLAQVLDDLEFKHAEMGQVWREFALNSGLPDPGFPVHYLISENSRNLLAYVASIAVNRPRPLQSLQLRFPTQILPAGRLFVSST